MKERKLGKTGIVIPPIAVGCMRIAGKSAGNKLP